MKEGDRYLSVLEEVSSWLAHRSISYPVTVIAVSKGAHLESLLDVYEKGCLHFGENRIPEALEKKPRLPPDVHWHMIGTIQTKKVPKIIGSFDLIHSVDRLELLEAIHERSLKENIISSVLLQANCSGEPSKQGVTPQVWEEVWDRCKILSHVRIEGLMTMGPLHATPSVIASTFKNLRILRDNLVKRKTDTTPLHHLSMGMSGDWKIGIDEGATMLRIGTKIFNKI